MPYKTLEQKRAWKERNQDKVREHALVFYMLMALDLDTLKRIAVGSHPVCKPGVVIGRAVPIAADGLVYQPGVSAR